MGASVTAATMTTAHIFDISRRVSAAASTVCLLDMRLVYVYCVAGVILVSMAL